MNGTLQKHGAMLKTFGFHDDEENIDPIQVPTDVSILFR